MSSLQDRIDEFRRSGVEVYGLSVDTHFAAAAWAKELGLTFPMLSDFNREGMTALGITLDEFIGYRNISHRAIIIVDRDRVVRYMDVAPIRGMPDPDAALNAARALAHG